MTLIYKYIKSLCKKYPNMFTCERQWKDIFIYIFPVGRKMLMNDYDSKKIGLWNQSWLSQQNQWKTCQEQRFLNESLAHLHWMQLQEPGPLSRCKRPEQWSGTPWGANLCDIEETCGPQKVSSSQTYRNRHNYRGFAQGLAPLCMCPFPGSLHLARAAMLQPPTESLASARKAGGGGSWNGNTHKLQTERTNGQKTQESYTHGNKPTNRNTAEIKAINKY